MKDIINKINKTLSKNKKLTLTIASLVLVFGIIIGYSFSFYVKTDIIENNVVSTECFKLSYTDENDIYLDKTYPMSEEEGTKLVPYEFTIKNTCNRAAQYSINIEKLDGSTLDDNYLRFKFDDNQSKLIGDLDVFTTKVNDNAISSRNIKSAILLPNEEQSYSLRLWVDEETTKEQSANKLYKSKIVISALDKKDPYIEITFNPNGGTLDNNVISYIEGRPFGSLPTPDNKGYVFVGWYKNASLNDEDAVSIYDLVSNDYANLYAKYTEGTYKLSIDPNGGEYNSSPGVYEANVTYGDTYTLGTASKEGHSFTSWSVVSGSETTVDGNVVTMGNEDAVVRANYDINTYKLTVKPNGGTWNGSTNNQEFNLEYNSTKEIVNPTREGYTFTGWTVSSGSLSSTTYTIGASDATLTATWAANDYKWVVYHNKMNVNGEGYTLANTEEGSGSYGSNFQGTLKNYTGFTNPTRASKQIGVDVKSNETGTPTNNVLDYNYTRNKYSVIVKPNGGKYNDSTSDTTHSDIYFEATYTINNPSRTGYNFGGWTTTGTDSSITDTTFKMGSENATLTAKWTAKSYNLTLNNQSPTTPGDTTVSATYDAAIPNITIPEKTGFLFDGYYTEEDGAGTKYINADGTSAKNWDLDENKTLYAKWIQLTASMFTYSNSTYTTCTTVKCSLDELYTKF